MLEDPLISLVTGTYKPQIHTHYLPHLSLSFARHTVSLNTTFCFLSSDYSKSVHLQADRSIELHTPDGCHYTIRIPRYGRDLQYDKRTAEALVPSVGVNENGMGEVFRLNLELGRFMKGFEVDVGGDDLRSAGAGSLQGGIKAGSVNVAALAEESHNLQAFGTSLGTVEFWDPRCRDRIGSLQPPWSKDVVEGGQEITAAKFHRSGLNFATGSSAGLTHVYDMRMSTPLVKKDQGFGFPIQDLIWLTPSTESQGQSMEPKLLSADKRIIKIWDARNGQSWTSVEPAVDLHSVAWCQDSGMFLTANEGRQQHSFFIPQLGPAPKWCSFLDNLVEEMAEDPDDPNAYNSQRAGEVYDNYKFLTTEQIETLNLSHLIGTTTLLRPYMHGFFVAQKLYEEAKLIADPFTWEEERARRIRSKIESERDTRIRGTKKVKTKVNKNLAEKVMEKEQRALQRRAKLAPNGEGDTEQQIPAMAQETEEAPPSLLTDSRFAKLFEDQEFAIDESSKEFRAFNPSTTVAKDQVPRKITAVEEDDLDEMRDASDSLEEDSVEGMDKAPKQPKKQEASKPELKVVSNGRTLLSKHDRSFGSRTIRSSQKSVMERPVVGEKEIQFTPVSRKKQPTTDDGRSRQARDKQRRSASGNVMRRLQT